MTSEREGRLDVAHSHWLSGAAATGFLSSAVFDVRGVCALPATGRRLGTAGEADQADRQAGSSLIAGALAAKIPQDADKIDPKLQAQFEITAKKYGFASYAEYDDVFNNVSLVMSGIDLATKAFTEPPEALKRQIAEVQADKKMSKEEKKQALEDMNEALKDAKPVEFKENVALVTKYLDKLGAIMQQQP